MHENKRLQIWASCLTAFVFLCCTSPVAHAQLTDPHLGVTLKAGTTGAGIDITKSILPNLNLRAGYNRFDYNADFTEGGVDYNGDLTLENVPILLDWHLFSGGFRLSAGAYYNNNNLDLESRANTSVTIGNTVFTPAQLGTLNGDVDFGNPVVPYLGIGWGNAVGKGNRWGISLDIGVFYQGEPDVTLTQSGGLVAVSAADLALEEKQLEDELDDFKFYPVATLGLHYRF